MFKNILSQETTTMASKRPLEELFKDHEARISRLEALLSPSKPAQKPARTQKLPDHILNLRKNGFFSQPRTAIDTHKKLKGTYHCEVDRVAMALLRLASRKQLRKASKVEGKKRYQAYVW